MSTVQINTKVCIIGATATGLLLANILSKNHIPYIAIDKGSPSKIDAGFDPVLIDSQATTILRKFCLSDRLFKEGTPQSQCEFRTTEQSFILDYAQKCGNQVHYNYSRSSLLVDLLDNVEHSREILFNTQNITITNNSHGAKVECQRDGQDLVIDCDFIAGCDGFNGITRQTIPQAILQPRYKNFDYAWLKITVNIPSPEHIVYATHPRGFAGQMLGDDKHSRYYLQIPQEDAVADWHCDRIWTELELRLAKQITPAKGKIIDVQMLKMQSFVTKTMQHQRLFLAGNSAHMMTPVGDKNLNLAIQDADFLGKALVDYYRHQNNHYLKNYSTTRIPEILKMQQFCESWLHMINVRDCSTPLGRSIERVQQFKRSQLINSEIYALDFARKYVGYTSLAQPSIPSKISSQTQLKQLVIV